MPRSSCLLALAALAASALSSLACASRMVPLTQDIRVQNNLSDDELRGLQYYVSDDIVLRRIVESQDRRITGAHKLQIVAGKMVEEILIEKGTPGVATAVGTDFVAVSFEPDASLQFSLRRTADPLLTPGPAGGSLSVEPNPFPGNRGEAPRPLLPRQRTGPETGVFWLGVDPRTNLVPYMGKMFEPVGNTLDAHLMVKAESLESQVETKRVLPGIRLPQDTAPSAAPLPPPAAAPK